MYKQTAQDVIHRLKLATPEEFQVLERSFAADTRKSVQNALAQTRKRFAADAAEEKRLNALYQFDKENSKGLVVGLDEVGRGPLAGPLAVGGVVLPNEPVIAGLNDSKKIPEAKRDAIAQSIQNISPAWTVVFIAAEEIDRIGMAAALRKAFCTAIAEIDASIDGVGTILLDGNPLYIDSREISVVKGDSKSAAIAAASIIAKTHRDALMRDLALCYPGYHFERNKGYASHEHIDAIRRNGLCALHRRSFCSGFLQDSLF